MSEIKVGSIKGLNASSAAISIDNSSGSATANLTTINSVAMPNGGSLSNRNIIINGEHKIDQRNSGSAVTVNGGGFGGRKFVTDRFSMQHNGTASITGQQVTDTPAGYKNSLKMTVATAESAVDAADYLFVGYRLEGNDASVLECGTSNAQEFTVSFWVKSSITGTYCLSFSNYADNRSHRKEYTISAANTWERKTVTLTADTTGTWLTNNSGGLNVTWMLLGGSNSQGAANTWTADIKSTTSNQTQWASTLGATFFITAIQLELGGVATEFEHKPITQDLALSQRYFQKLDIVGNSYSAQYTLGNIFDGGPIPYIVEMRAQPNSITYSKISGQNYWVEVGVAAFSANSTTGMSFSIQGTSFCRMRQGRQSGNSTPTRREIYIWEARFNLLVDAEL